MKVVLFGNNELAAQVATTIRSAGDEIVALVCHPPERARAREKLVVATAVSPERVFQADSLSDPQLHVSLADAGAEIGMSVLFGYRIPDAVLHVFPRGALNLHPALLPYNRGAFPNVWSIVERTPAGVTIHVVDSGIDTGDIVAQREVPVYFKDTGETLYRRLEEAALALFRERWPVMRSGHFTTRSQPADKGTSHRVRDVSKIDPIDLAASYKAEDLLNIIRARTFPPYPGAYVVVDGKRLYLRLKLLEEHEL